MEADIALSARLALHPFRDLKRRQLVGLSVFP
jgi:hypothetical protein